MMNSNKKTAVGNFLLLATASICSSIFSPSSSLSASAPPIPPSPEYKCVVLFQMPSSKYVVTHYNAPVSTFETWDSKHHINNEPPKLVTGPNGVPCYREPAGFAEESSSGWITCGGFEVPPGTEIYQTYYQFYAWGYGAWQIISPFLHSGGRSFLKPNSYLGPEKVYQWGSLPNGCPVPEKEENFGRPDYICNE
jgi:hypothetical protein